MLWCCGVERQSLRTVRARRSYVRTRLGYTLFTNKNNLIYIVNKKGLKSEYSTDAPQMVQAATSGFKDDKAMGVGCCRGQ